MNATEVTTADYLLFDYPFSLALIVLVVLVCTVVMLGSLFLERRVLGVRTVSLFALLRLLASRSCVLDAASADACLGGIDFHEESDRDLGGCEW